MDFYLLKIIFALIIFILTLIAGWIPFYKQSKTLSGHEFPRGEALASGVFLGAGLIHMLGKASMSFTQMHIQYPLAFLLCGASFLVLLLLEHLGGEFRDHTDTTHISIAIVAIIMLSIHSLFAGTALGLSENLSTFIMIFIAIIAHKWAAGFSLAVQINKSQLSFKAGIMGFTIFAIMAPIGILLGDTALDFTESLSLLIPVFNALAAGTFLYIGTLHGLKRSVMVERCCNLREFSFVILGFTIMALIAIWG